MQFLTETVEKIHTKNSSPLGKKFVISTTGGGYSSHYYLMSQPGASNTILELNGPYARQATLDLLNRDSKSKTSLDQFASINAAQEMAEVSLKRAHKLLTMDCSRIEQLDCLKNGVGIGVACALASSSWKRGEHRCHIVIANSTQQIHFSLTLHKGIENNPFRTRQQEDELCGHLVVFTVAVASGQMELSNVAVNMATYSNLSEYDKLVVNVIDNVNPIKQLIEKQVNNVLYINGSMIQNVPLTLLGEYTDMKPKIVMLPGSFNPFHSGHKSALDSSLVQFDSSVGIYELCVSNVDKLSMEYEEVLRRLDQFKTTPIILTNTPRFMDKVVEFPGVSFAIGIDTAIRLIDPKYTNGDKKTMIDSIINMTSKGTLFFVTSRTYGVAGIPANFPLKLESTDLLTLSKITEFIPKIIPPFFIESIVIEFKDSPSSQLRKNQ